MLNKTYSPAEIEPRLYEGWESSGAFACAPDSNAQPFTIMIPPPNVTGSLHMGHALTFTVQDTLVRWRRMQGRDVLWQPGTDHAGIATQMVVERLLAGQGASRKELGREAFIERVWQWKAESGGTITRQLRRLGASLDWPRERFTMDEGLSKAVLEVFVTLHREGLIYRDRRLVNWDPKFQSAISDLEVENKEVRGHLWHIRYPVAEEPGRFITVATTRPETMLGDTAVAVHPEDPRYRDLIGKHAILPLVGRRIPIVADEYSDPEKGTGAVKITPAHDFNDFAVGQRHQLPMPSILDKEARVTLADISAALAAVPGVAAPDFVRSLEGQDRFAARKAIVAELERLELLEKTEPHTHQVPHGDRSGVPIEPLMTVQWYCNAGVLAKPAIEAVEQGRTKFVPQQWENTFFAWMRDIQPWCISRQLWWGHRIPAWYGPDGHVFVERSEEEVIAAARAHYGDDRPLARDEDVLDTWFSSALWPFSTLGWPEQTKELARYYPGDVLVTGFDIIFFWVARMMMMGLHFMKDVPFRAVHIHGLVRDERGQKMSKSKGNVIDPLELIDRYGADALRFTICALTGPGRDVKLGPARVESYRSFVTKLWNAARFCEMNGIAPDPTFEPAQATLPLTRWILAALSDAITEATGALEAYRFNDYAAACYRFTWNTFCDWFLEFAKPALSNAAGAEAAEVKRTAAYVLGQILRLLHPATPFVTEELWDRFGYGPECSLIRAPWPEPFSVPGAAEARAELDWVVRLISEVRTVRAEMNVPPSQLSPILLKDARPDTLARAASWMEAISRMARASSLGPLDGELPKGAAQAVVDEATVVLPLAGVIDLAAERARLQKERAKAAGEAEKIAKKLGNADFVARAPEDVVEENRDRLQAAHNEMARLDAALQRIA
ncbi:valine--tRNA ligase [Limobrevibacterium gyesilva]|uniref:Valine--tRNA ligase n=1 Tax=Limobrevibacterium gyesilva TaxID=2991712 RepID=A0AA41YPA2_9PROT|nr:valine--tRNA ligase [Limobrevibacterium gyesilva]MCW3475753.1 valine--tRNA ligase [Limobrevibacterium gyesilva]